MQLDAFARVYRQGLTTKASGQAEQGLTPEERTEEVSRVALCTAAAQARGHAA